MGEEIDSTKFIETIHDLVSDSKECIELIEEKLLEEKDEVSKDLLGASATLLRIHIKVITQLSEHNLTIIDQVMDLKNKLEQEKEERN